MAMTQTKWHEPITLAQGETISFTRMLSDFLPSDGWSLTYALRGGAQAISFSSTSSGNSHIILVPSAITATWLAGTYQLEGLAVNTDGTKHQFYLNNFAVTTDLTTAPADLDTRTFAQKMLENIESALLDLSQNSLQRTSVEMTEIDRVRRLDLMAQREKLLQERRGELARQAAKNQKPTGRKIQTVLFVTAPGTISGQQFGAGNSVNDYQYP